MDVVCCSLFTAIILFCRYQHSHHLVTTLNQFADVKADLPKGWEKKLNKEGKVGGYNTYQHMYMYIHVHVYVQCNLNIIWTLFIWSLDYPD